MQITADVSKTWKPVQRDVAFFKNVLSEYTLNFFWFSIVLAKRNAVSFK